MTYLLLQTFLLLLSAYFAGAMSACLLKRALMTRSAETAAVVARTSAATYAEPPVENIPLIKPREIDPVQPRIEVLPRPARKVLPVSEKIDTSRFERALTGPDPNEGMPRKMIVQIRPAILKPVTGPAQPFKKPEPKAEAPKVEAPKVEAAKPVAAKADSATTQQNKVDAPKTEPAKPAAVTTAPAPKGEPAKSDTGKTEPSKAEAAAAQAAANVAASQKAAPQPANDKPKGEPSKDTVSTPTSGGMMAGIAGASAAAAAAVAAAKAAAAAVMPRPAPPSPQPHKPVVEIKPADPAKPSAAVTAAVSPPVAKPDPEAANAKPSETKPAAPQPVPGPSKVAQPPAAQDAGHAFAASGTDDLQRIRAIDADTSRRLNGIGIGTFEQIAHWTPADVNRVNQQLGLAGRVDREQWIEQAQILAMGGETYYSRNRAAVSKSPAAAQPASAPASTASGPATSTPAQPPSSKSEPVAPSSAQPAVQSQSQPQSSATEPAKSAAAAPVVAEPAKPAAAAPAPAAPSSPAPAASVASTLQGKSVAEMATAAAAAIAAASASVTRGIRPIEPISPLARANPNLVMPAKLSDALKDNESKAPAAPTPAAPQAKAPSGAKPDDLKRIRGVGVLIEKRLNALGITTYAQVANWNSGDIDRISQTLEFKGRIERESWIEQARILSSGGDTEFSRRVDRGDVETSRDDS